MQSVRDHFEFRMTIIGRSSKRLDMGRVALLKVVRDHFEFRMIIIDQSPKQLRYVSRNLAESNFEFRMIIVGQLVNTNTKY